MTQESHSIAGSIATSVITGLAVLLPEAALSFALKVISVFVLAMVAEAGRRVVASLGKKKP